MSLPDGRTGWTCEYSREGYPTRFRKVDGSGKSIGGLNSVFLNGNEVEWEHVDENDELVVNKMGIAGENRTFENGRLASQMYFGPDRLPVLDKEGKAGVLFEYDPCGREIKRIYVGTDGKPIIATDRTAGRKTVYDEDGNQTENWCLGIDGEPCQGEDGHSGIRLLYDDFRNLTGVSFLSADGAPAADTNGVYGWTSTFARGRETSRRWIGADGEPCRAADGTLGWDRTYDEYGNELTRADVL